MRFEDLQPGDEISYQLTPDDRDTWHGRVLLLFPDWQGMRVEVLDRGKRSGNVDLLHVSQILKKTRYRPGPVVPDRASSEKVACARCGGQTATGTPPRCAAWLTALSAPLHPVKKLSPRELEVLRELVRPRSTREIATRLSISEGNVWTHLSRMMEKLHMADRAALVRFAWQQGDDQKRGDALE